MLKFRCIEPVPSPFAFQGGGWGCLAFLSKGFCSMKHKKTLYQLPSFWAAILIPMAFGVSFAFFIAWNDFFSVESMAACWTSDCINGAINRLKVPIAITALIFPAVALVASQHRSAQTAAQIERTDKQIAATEAKNAFENNIKHREIFQGHLSALEDKYKVSCQKKDRLYKELFVNNDYVTFEVYVDADAFIHKFIRFDNEQSRDDKVKYMRSVILNDLHMALDSEERRTFDNEEIGDFETKEISIINLYFDLVSWVIDFCLSPEDAIEVSSGLLGAHELIEEIYQEMF